MLAPEVPMSHSVAGEPPVRGRHAVPPTVAPYSAAEWDLLSSLPSWTVAVTATHAPVRGVAAGLAGLDAVAAGRSFDSDLVRAVVATIYARHDGSASAPRGWLARDAELLAGDAELLAVARAAARLLERRADPADSAAYRQWVQSVAARVCRAGPSRGGPVARSDRRFLDRLGDALGLG
ncbi:hypothetical protein [Salinispora sp. H7-4]|uniref:hypothetical protein n=1 Tax=Salinispora sp. H7-4 TaxID=2748321 RepID=UPI0015D21C5C|nr:hypothetical protein [Salinispora sp. H7-4]NYT96698.1 hypothetical protein [Salinispora sp. H7-4]